LKDGYYLSTYLQIDPVDHLLDMNFARHDQNVALFHKQGQRISLVRYWEIERLTGLKQHAYSFYDKQHAESLLNQLLSHCDLTLEDMVEIWGTPQLQTCDDYLSSDVDKNLTFHSMGHLFSAIMLDSDIFYKGQIIGLAVDDSPDLLIDRAARNKSFFAGCVIRQGQAEFFPVSSPGPLWYWATRKYGRQPGTLMALATASTSQAYLKPSRPLTILSDRHDGELETFFDSLKSIERLTEGDAGTLFNGFDPRFTEEENKVSMSMKLIQDMSIRIMENNIVHILDKYSLDPAQTVLAMAGGFVLNCPTNSHLMKTYNFSGFMAPPCVNDGGISLGIGLYAFYKKMNGHPMEFKIEHPYFGTSDNGLDELLHAHSHFVEDVTVMENEQIVKDLMQQPVIWFDSHAEMGPRALGHRSILGDPRQEQTKHELNVMKKREWWRPVAPVVVDAALPIWFEDAYPSPYMLHTFLIKKEKQAQVPAVSHLDGTARVQNVSERTNPRLHDVIQAFGEKTGVPMLCNTSLNDKDEPIIDSLSEAINFALRKGIRVAYLNGMRVKLTNHTDYQETKPAQRAFEMQILNEEEREAAWQRVNPHNVPVDILKYYKLVTERNPERNYDLTNAEDVKALTKEIKRFRAMYKQHID